ncbi:MAG: tRNA (adenosine(37)-N6)-threonylcarbamoyltransferase complex transferase subunit TsaD [Elusimicrobia bacterium]|nr:tRNA (adenosine(37)-N6)-threonylcarbamoyltransferase complex transferase subunit TsaD [Elusimicrobiota bacterium]
MRILGIETSCDETAAAVVENGTRILSDVIASQASLHAEFLGVVPEIASRAHLELLLPCIQKALCEASLDLSHLDAIAFTRGPGLPGALLMGKVIAQTLSWTHSKPLLGIQHLEGHFFSNLLQTNGRTVPDPLPLPAVALIVSGGHTDLLHIRSLGKYHVLGRTLDDAAGEAFDKLAKLLRMGYPGGPLIDRASRAGNPGAFSLPRPTLPGSFNFSFSGLKTSALYLLKDAGFPIQSPKGMEKLAADPAQWRRRLGASLEDLCASFQEAIVDTLVQKTLHAAQVCSARSLFLGGGVACNRRLREKMKRACGRENLPLFCPPPPLCTDNAAMIASAAYFQLRSGKFPKKSSLSIHPSLPFINWNAEHD